MSTTGFFDEIKQEKRRDLRIKISLEVYIRRGTWVSHSTEDISKRGIFIKTIGNCPLNELVWIRIVLPYGETPLDMMAKAVRRISYWKALESARSPGIGLEFFCLTDQALNRWDALIRHIYQHQSAIGDTNGYDLYRALEQLHHISHDAPPVPSARAKNRSNLIFRPTLPRLEGFMLSDLPSGKFNLHIPYKMEDSSPVTLRVIHPHTYEEYLIFGKIQKDIEKEHYWIVFDNDNNASVKSFKRFLLSGLSST